MRTFIALAFMTAALAAQTPAPSASAKAAEDVKTIEALRAENPVAAFAKAKALLPAARPAFDRTSLATAFAGIKEWNGQLDLIRAAYDTGVAAGQFEEARGIAEKGRDMAADLQKEAQAAFNNYKASWEKAAQESQQALAEMKTLEAEAQAPKPAPAPASGAKLSVEEANAEIMRQAEAAKQKAEAAQRLAFLKANEAVLKENIEKVKTVMVPLERPMKDMDGRTRGFEAAIAQWDKYLQEEAQDIAKKYKGDKSVYAAGLLRGVAPKPEKVDAALVALHRAAVLDPKNSAITKRIAQLQGKAAAPAAKAAKPAKSKGKGRKG
jgi:hypothetical protein